MSADLYGPHGEVLVDTQTEHISNLTRGVLMLLARYSGELQHQLRDGLPATVRAHVQEEHEAVSEAMRLLVAGAVALGFIDASIQQGSQVEVRNG